MKTRDDIEDLEEEAGTRRRCYFCERLDRAEKGIAIRRGEPVRVEVVGSGSAEMKKGVAEAAAKSLAERGHAVDPAAAVGVRVKLSGQKRVTVVSKTPFAPPGFDVNKNSARGGYEIAYTISLFGRDGCETPALTTNTLHGFADDKGRLDAFYQHVGTRAGDLGIPIEGNWDRTGPVELLGTTRLGIDGVLEP
jgi:hypothetical protein